MTERLQWANKTSHVVCKDYWESGDELVGRSDHHLLLSDVVRVRDGLSREYAVQ